MSRHIRIACPNCQRSDLRIRPEYLGRRVTCKHCHHEFPAGAAEDPGTRPRPAGHSPPEQAAIDVAEPRATALEVERMRAELGTQTGQYTATLQRLRDVEGRLGQSQDRVRGLQEQLDQARGQLRRDSERRDERAEADADRDRLRAELEALRAGRDRLEVDRLEGSRLEEQLRAELAEARRRLAEEASLREAVGGELTRGRDEAIAAWEAERRAWQSRDEELRARLQDAERRLVEEQARSEAASRDWRERLDAVQARFDWDRQALQEETGRLLREAEAQARGRDAAIQQFEAARQEHPRFQAEIARLVAEAEDARRRADETGRRGDELAGRVRELQGELDHERSDRAAELRGGPEQIEAARRQHDRDRAGLQEEVQRIRREADAARAEVESLTRERDDLAARHDEAELALRMAEQRHRDEVRDQAASAARRDDELGEQIRTLRDELERRRRDQEAEQQASRRGPAGVDGEPDPGHAEATGEREDPSAVAADRAELHRLLVAAREELRAAIERSDALEAEAMALRDRSLLPGRSVAVGRADLGGDLEDDRRRIEELTEQLRRARGANEQFCSILNVFGLISPHEKEGTGR